MNKIISVGYVVALIAMVGCSGEPGAPGKDGAPGVNGLSGVNGTDGKDGEKGEKGISGLPGTSVTTDSAKIVKSIFCTGTLSGTTGLSFNYHVVQFANGNVFTSGGIGDGAYETNATAIYAPSQVGWDSASVIVQHDSYTPLDGGWWNIKLNRSTLITSIVYNDVDMVPATTTWTMTSDKCVVNNY